MALSFSEWLLEKKHTVSVHPDIDAWLNSADNLKKDISVLKDLIDRKKKKQQELDKKPKSEPDDQPEDKDRPEKPEDEQSSDQPEPKNGATKEKSLDRSRSPKDQSKPEPAEESPQPQKRPQQRPRRPDTEE